ncbi:cytochrome b5 isoform 5-T5 [Molossus nigricans]
MCVCRSHCISLVAGFSVPATVSSPQPTNASRSFPLALGILVGKKFYGNKLVEMLQKTLRMSGIRRMLENSPKHISSESCIQMTDRRYPSLRNPNGHVPRLETLITTVDSDSSWWTNWMIPAVSALAVALMYHFYMAED